MSSFIPYQVDYSVQNAAKTLGFSKKRVTFKFGFANRAAIQAGETGPQCRGSEHEIIFIWSLASGKRQILCDNKDVHFSASGQNGWTNDRAWQHVFTLRDSSNQSYRVHFLSQPVVKDMPNAHPFDIKIGGLSYFQFNPIYQLGTPRMVIGQAPAHHRSGRDSPMSAEERQQLAAAKLASLHDIAEQKEREASRLRAVEAPPAPPPDAPLISFDDDAPPPPAPVPATVQPPIGTMFSASSISLDPMLNDSSLEFSRQQPGSFYGSNPYSMNTSVGGSQPSLGGGYSMPTNPYAPPTSSFGSTPTSASTALTPYQPAGVAAAPQQPYVDATGRLNMSGGPYGSNPYEYTSTSSIPPLASPSAMSYGSAPSFAQPPKPPANPYGSTQPSYGEAPTQYANPYGATAEAPSPYANNPYGTTTQPAPSPYANPYAPEPYANPYGATTAAPEYATNPYAAPSPTSSTAYGTNPYGSAGPSYGAPPTPATYNPY
jgi:hypothetical protein